MNQIIQTIDEFNNWIFYVVGYEEPLLSLDFETTSLNYLDMEFVGFSMAKGLDGVYVSNPDLLPYLGNLVKTGKWIFHFAPFDLKCLKKFCNSEPKEIFCTLTAAKLIDENLDSYSLKELAYSQLGIPWKQIKKWEEVKDNTNSPEFIKYATNDALWTYQLFEQQKSNLAKQGLEHLFYSVEMPFQFVLRDLEIEGVLVDKKKLEEFRNDCRNNLFDIESDMLRVFNKNHSVERDLWGENHFSSPINFGSSKQLIDCCGNLGFQVTEKTKKGNPSVGKVYLQKMLGKHLFFDLLWRYKKLQKLQNSFLEPLEGFIDSDGRIRPSYNMVRTGRLSCSEPNLQQLPNPKREKLEFNHRELFISRPGNVLVRADYSGQELRNLAEVSRDEAMINAFNRNHDLHLITANRIFNMGLNELDYTTGTKECLQIRKKHEDKRKKANTINYGILYGATAKRIAKDNKVPVEEAERWLDMFFELHPGVIIAIEKTKRELYDKGYVTTLMGRRRRFPYYRFAQKWEQEKMERQAFNFKIQGFSADQMKIAAGQVLKRFPDCKYVLSVHDELVWEVSEDEAEGFSQTVKDIMEHCVCLSVPVIVDVSIVKNYGD